MEAIQIQKKISNDGKLYVDGLPCKKGDEVKIILFFHSENSPKPVLTANDLRYSELIGLWHKRDDINDSAIYARQLREQAQQR